MHSDNVLIQTLGGILAAILLALISWVGRGIKRWAHKVLEHLELLEKIPTHELQLVDHEQRIRNVTERTAKLEGVLTTPGDPV